MGADNGIYKIRAAHRPGQTLRQSDYTHYSITIPKRIGDVIPDDVRFKPEMHEDGILLRAIPSQEVELEVPDWCR